MEVRETLWKRCLSTPTTPPAKNSNICLSETSYQHKGTRKKCKKTNQAAIIQWQRQCLMYKPHRKPWPKSKTSDISKQGPSPLHHTFLLGRARFTAQPLSALVISSRLCHSSVVQLYYLLRLWLCVLRLLGSLRTSKTCLRHRRLLKRTTNVQSWKIFTLIKTLLPSHRSLRSLNLSLQLMFWFSN